MEFFAFIPVGRVIFSGACPFSYTFFFYFYRFYKADHTKSISYQELLLNTPTGTLF